MSENRSREFLKKCAHTAEFNQATGGGFENHIRMGDRELVLRYCAFSLLGVDGYAKQSGGSTMDAFLERATEMLDDPRQVPDAELDQLYENFRADMLKCYTVFGEHSFRKWPAGTDRKYPINRPLFESWSYTLRSYGNKDLAARRDAITAAARDLMGNREYNDAITSGTNNATKVRLRFESAARAAQVGS